LTAAGNGGMRHSDHDMRQASITLLPAGCRRCWRRPRRVAWHVAGVPGFGSPSQHSNLTATWPGKREL